MPSNDKLNDHERLIKISSGQPQNPHFLQQISADSRKLHLNFNIPIYHLHTNFRYLLVLWRSYKEVHTRSPHLPTPKWFFILGNYGYMNVMSVVSILWPICKSEGSSKIFHLMNYIFLCCLPCKFCKCHKSPGADRLCGACQINRSLSKILSTTVSTTRWRPQFQ